MLPFSQTIYRTFRDCDLQQSASFITIATTVVVSVLRFAADAGLLRPLAAPAGGVHAPGKVNIWNGYKKSI